MFLCGIRRSTATARMSGIRGNAWQVHEKYLALARDASSSGDRVTAESYLQHAEHYFRIISQIQEAENRQRGPNNGGNGHPQNGLQGDDDDDNEDGDDQDGDERVPLNA